MQTSLFRSVRSGVSSARLSVAPVTLRTVRPMGTLKDRERAMEAAYFNKEDMLLMRKLLKKMKTQTDVEDKHGAAGVKVSELSALNEIIGKYKMSEEDAAALIEWRHSEAF